MTPQELGNIKPKKLNLKKLEKGKPWGNSTMHELGEMENASIFLPIIFFPNYVIPSFMLISYLLGVSFKDSLIGVLKRHKVKRPFISFDY